MTLAAQRPVAPLLVRIKFRSAITFVLSRKTPLICNPFEACDELRDR